MTKLQREFNKSRALTNTVIDYKLQAGEDIGLGKVAGKKRKKKPQERAKAVPDIPENFEKADDMVNPLEFKKEEGIPAQEVENKD